MTLTLDLKIAPLVTLDSIVFH